MSAVKKCAMCGKVMRTASDYPRGDVTKARCAECGSPSGTERPGGGRAGMANGECPVDWRALLYPRL